MSTLSDIGLIAIGFLLGFFIVCVSIISQVRSEQMVVIFSSDLFQYDVILGGKGNSGRLLWRNPRFKYPGEPEDMDLDDWR